MGEVIFIDNSRSVIKFEVAVCAETAPGAISAQEKGGNRTEQNRRTGKKMPRNGKERGGWNSRRLKPIDGQFVFVGHDPGIRYLN